MSEYRPCPFCGSSDHRIVMWADDEGEYDAVECCQCKAAAPADVWNGRDAKTQSGEQNHKYNQ